MCVLTSSVSIHAIEPRHSILEMNAGRSSAVSKWPMSMAELLLFHHAQGLMAGCLAFADDLRATGPVVHTPDLYAGKTFTILADGVGSDKNVGLHTIMDRGRPAA